MTVISQLTRELDARDLLSQALRIARDHHVTLDEMLGLDRSRAACVAREALWFELFETGMWTKSRLAQLFRRDRTTISKGLQAHALRLLQRQQITN